MERPAITEEHPYEEAAKKRFAPDPYPGRPRRGRARTVRLGLPGEWHWWGRRAWPQRDAGVRDRRRRWERFRGDAGGRDWRRRWEWCRCDAGGRGSPAVAGASQTWHVLVNNVSPAGENWSFNAFYPDHLQAHPGDTIVFTLAPNSERLPHRHGPDPGRDAPGDVPGLRRRIRAAESEPDRPAPKHVFRQRIEPTVRSPRSGSLSHRQSPSTSNSASAPPLSTTRRRAATNATPPS